MKRPANKSAGRKTAANDTVATVTPPVTMAAGTGGTTNARVVAIFNEIADLLDVEHANPFRVRAYRNAARTMGGLTQDVSVMLANGVDLDTLPGIGADLAGKIDDLILRVKNIEAQPLPLPLAGKARAVAKHEDGRFGDGDSIEKLLADPDQLALLAIKMAQRNGRNILPR